MTPTAQGTHQKISVAVLVGSTRPDRRALHFVRWLTPQLAERDDFDVDVIDLIELDLPARLPRDDDPRAIELKRRISDADAFIVVTPEYNHGYPASLKQAIDVPYREWNAKPVAFVSYGGMSGGIRAVEQLRQVFAELHTVTVRDGVAFPSSRVDVDGIAHDAERAAAAAKVMLDELAWWALALREARAARPYAA